MLAENEANLADVYRKQVRFADAEPLYKLALKSYEHNRSCDKSDYAACASGYALLLEATNRAPEATEIASRAHLTLSQARSTSRM